ncbi:MAG: PrsW family intramembrane metalloprotease [Verrucomicrobiales bacterium]|nr:PrsW family intramembrane metalloprotease [Verrucomicrobiales bacterium]
MKRSDLHRLTRRPAVIAWCVALVMAAGLLASIVLSRNNPEEVRLIRLLAKASEWEHSSAPTTPELDLLNQIRDRHDGHSPEDFIRHLLEEATNGGRELRNPHRPQHFPQQDNPAGDGTDRDHLSDAARQLSSVTSPSLADLPAARRQIFEDYLAATTAEGETRTMGETALLAAAAATPPDPIALAMKGDLLRIQRFPAEAIATYVSAGTAGPESPEAVDARMQALLCAAAHRRGVQLRRLLEEPAYQTALRLLSPLHQNDIVLAAGDFPGLVRVQFGLILQQVGNSPGSAAVTLLCGVIWYVMLHQVAGLRLRSSWRSLLAAVLGALSVTATLLILSLQEYHNAFEQSGDFLNDLLYFVAGVGLREEFSKLLFFAPLLLVLRRSSEAEVLVAAGCVGLGFAIAENLAYFAASSGLDVWGRFVMANFFHISLTALCGHALHRWVRRPAACWEQSLVVILSMVVLHGLYDFMLFSPDLPETMHLGGFSIILFIVLALRYLTTLRRVREPRGNAMGPEFVHLTGTALLFSSALMLGSWDLGLAAALDALTRSALELALLAGMFVWQLRGL